MKIVTFSDTHGLHNRIEIPNGDLLIFAGDMCGLSSFEAVKAFGDFLNGLPHQYKIVVAGNHDWPFVWNRAEAESLLPGVIYLEDSEITIAGLKFYGSPWQPEFNHWAYNLPRDGMRIQQIWDAIPDDTDILITHSPPAGILDSTPDQPTLGCTHLYNTVMDRVKPKLHVFGHIHESYGKVIRAGSTFVNASVCDGQYRPVNKVICVDVQ